jgi:hypothetical protein
MREIRVYPNMDLPVYLQLVRLFHPAWITVGTHSISDGAIDWVVDTYAEVKKERLWGCDTRPYPNAVYVVPDGSGSVDLSRGSCQQCIQRVPPVNHSFQS